MSSANVSTPTAPNESHLYPQQRDFRLPNINEILAALNIEVSHYRAAAKNYNQAKKFVDLGAAESSVLSAVFSSASFGSALSVISLPATIPLGGVGRAFALALYHSTKSQIYVTLRDT